MNLAITVLEIVAPVFLLAGVGFAWVRAGLEFRLQFVTRLAMTLAVPCLIPTSHMQTEIAPSALRAVSLAAIVACGSITLAMLLLVRIAGLATRTYLTPLT